MNHRKYTIEGVGERLDGFLRALIERGGFDLSFQISEGEAPHPDFENPDVTVRFKGGDVDLLLGNRAELLLAIEQVCLEYLRVPSEDHTRIAFDANDYRMLRIEELRLSARAAADRVKSTGRPFAFNPMNSRERRVIHLSLRDEHEVRSESAGMGPGRQVIVYPAGMPSSPPPPVTFGGPPRRSGPPGRGPAPGGGARPPRRGPR
ncbi:MAG: protein jag [Bryobacteraceae bacterium]